jgi:hypothetical protein
MEILSGLLGRILGHLRSITGPGLNRIPGRSRERARILAARRAAGGPELILATVAGVADGGGGEEDGEQF